MGEHKFEKPTRQITQQLSDELAKTATDKGKLVEVGWIAMLAHVIPQGMEKEAVAMLRQSFFMGAQHLYASIMCILDPGREPTAQDMARMELIHNELEIFRAVETGRRHDAPGRTQ